VTLRSEVVDLVRASSLNNSNQAAGIGHVAMMQEQAGILLMRVLVEMVNPICIE